MTDEEKKFSKQLIGKTVVSKTGKKFSFNDQILEKWVNITFNKNG